MRLPKPRTMFLLDGLGGLVTAGMLCVVLPSMHTMVGLSPQLLRTLGAIGAAYATYSLGCFALVGARWPRALAVLLVANVLYCAVSALVVRRHLDALTTLGIAYFALEIVAITALVGLELAVLRRGLSP